MVDFRYHLVSIIAVFLALAVGIVVGTTTLNGPVLNDLEDRVAGLTRDKRALESDLRDAQQLGAQQEQAVGLLAPDVVDGRLAGQRVVLVSTPEAPAPPAEQLVPLLREAGATVGLQVRLRPALFEPASVALLTDLVARVALPGERLPQGEPADQALGQLAQVLARPAAAEAVRPEVVQRVLAAYEGEDLVEVEGEPTAGGSLGVVLTGPPGDEPAGG
ncbi:MAG: copper transporter, partial [Actinomycetota bacterium]|nr:copper transporter [Actinomycetota bacterium]